MKSIVAVNVDIPTVEDHVDYMSGDSLRDYDITVFDPEFPWLERISFSGGGSCLAIEPTNKLLAAIIHWKGEIDSALKAGKTVFYILNDMREDSGAVGYETKTRNARSYNTTSLNNYSVLPFQASPKNTKGRRISAIDKAYKPLLDVVSEIASYKVIFEKPFGHPIYSAQDGATVGAVVKFKERAGHLVLIPYFDFQTLNQPRSHEWSDKAIRVSHGLVAQLVAIDRSLRSEGSLTPPPQWVAEAKIPEAVRAVDIAVEEINDDIAALEVQKKAQIEKKDHLLSFQRLLYENGKLLESAIEEGLKVLGYAVENYQDGDIEIDHVIVGPSGLRMIGESEGKDTSAIDISKFRQLESNINEDFERDGVEMPAKGILFGNGYRFTEPKDRAEQFTTKCLTNAKRLQTALVRTADLYEAVIHALDHPDDEEFRSACRSALESTSGEVVVFPSAKVEPANQISS